MTQFDQRNQQVARDQYNAGRDQVIGDQYNAGGNIDNSTSITQKTINKRQSLRLLGIALIAAVVAGSALAVPRLFHPGNGQTGVMTQPMPTTQISCPAPGTARAAVTRPLATGSHQDVVFVEVNYVGASGQLERYDTMTHQYTTIAPYLPIDVQGATPAQLSPDGAWIIFAGLVGDQAAIQMVRLDGQGLQTLHCAPTGHTIFGLAWSPDQQTLAFNEGTGEISSFRSNIGDSANTYLLQLATGQLHRLLLQPAYIPEQYGETGYYPRGWINNTQLYMDDYATCCSDNSNFNTNYTPELHLLDLKQGFNQHPDNLRTVLTYGRCNPSSLTAFSVDKSNKLFMTQCPVAVSYTSDDVDQIIEQDATGRNARTIYTDPHNDIKALTVIDANNLLLLATSVIQSEGTGVTDAGYEVWKLNLVTQQKTLLVPNQGEDMFGFSHTINSWGNISRDGSTYAIVDYKASNFYLIIGTLQGSGTLQTLLPAPSGAIDVIGWTSL